MWALVLVRFFLGWLVEQRSVVAIGLAVLLLAVTVTLHYAFGFWWPTGVVLATIFGFVGLIASKGE